MTCDADRIFQCQQCGQCCHGFGGTYLTTDDVRAIAAEVGCSPADFLSRFCRYSGGRPLLAQRPDGYCVFWDELCTIHRVKPRMCRRWPFIPAVLRDVANWHAMAASCPGMRTDVPDRVIREVVAAILAREPEAGISS